jgi:hypothetical protein
LRLHFLYHVRAEQQPRRREIYLRRQPWMLSQRENVRRRFGRDCVGARCGESATMATLRLRQRPYRSSPLSSSSSSVHAFAT